MTVRQNPGLCQELTPYQTPGKDTHFMQQFHRTVQTTVLWNSFETQLMTTKQNTHQKLGSPDKRKSNSLDSKQYRVRQNNQVTCFQGL